MPLEPFVLGGQTYAAVESPIAAAVVVQRATSGDVFMLDFTAALEGPCMRCLDDARVTMRANATEYQAMSPAPGRASHGVRRGSGLLMTSWVRDLIGAGLPEQILCRPECAGLCAFAGRTSISIRTSTRARRVILAGRRSRPCAGPTPTDSVRTALRRFYDGLNRRIRVPVRGHRGLAAQVRFCS